MRTWKTLLLLAVLVGIGTAITCHLRETSRIKWNDQLVRIATEALKASAEFRDSFLSEFEKNRTDYEALRGFCARTQERISPLSTELGAMKPTKGSMSSPFLWVSLITARCWVKGSD